MHQKFEKKDLIKKSEDFSGWYTDVVQKSGLADYAPVKGCQVIRPYGYAIWENIQKILDSMIKEAGVKNAYFPLFIPEGLLKKEKQHIKGFSPELAVVTIGGGKKLKENLVVRPTSETIMYKMFADWIKSWRDLPFLINQWANVVRWEKRPRLFLRTTEFLWQEGHTVHETYEEAKKEALRALKMYVKLYQEFFAIDGIWGRKSENEKFPGADTTLTYEILMPDGKALQGCTSHNLGQNFAKSFNIVFQGRDGKKKFAWQTSWGLSTRSLGALIMVHGDDQGLIIPPKLAPVQIVVIPIFQGRRTDRTLKQKAYQIKDILQEEGIRAEIDERKEYSVGWKFNDWELKGVPLRIEIGPQEITKNKLTIAIRDTGEKKEIKIKELKPKIKKELDLIQKRLFEKSRKFLRKHTKEVSEYQEFKEALKNNRGFIKAFWCENPKCEERIKTETRATTRCLPHNSKEEKGKCIYCGKPAKRKWIFAQAY